MRLTTRVTAAFVMLLGARLVAACGSSAPQSGALPDDPCAILTVAQVAAATKLDVISARRVPSVHEEVLARREARATPPGSICSYETRSDFGDLIVSVPPAAEQTAARYYEIFELDRQRGGAITALAPGLGQHAWTSGGVSVHVLVRDDVQFSISTQRYQPQSREIVIALAHAFVRALSRESRLVDSAGVSSRARPLKRSGDWA